MARKQRGRQMVRSTADDHPPPVATPRPPGAATGPSLSEHVEVQAQKLIHQTGSPDAAKSAVDVAAERERASDFREDHFAVRCGFTSRAELRAASKPLTAPDGANWWATALKKGRWVIWNHEDMAAGETFPSLEEAKRRLEHAAAARA